MPDAADLSVSPDGDSARWQALSENSNGIVSVHGLDARFRHVSAGITAILGYRPDEFIGRHPLDDIHPDDRDRHQRRLRGLASSREPVHTLVRVRRKDASWAWIESVICPIFDTDGACLEFLGVSREISPDREATSAGSGGLTDSVTGLPNREAFHRRLSQLDGPLSFVLIDLDDLSAINDDLGRPIGDQVLAELATRLLDVVPDTMLARVSGAPFVLLLTGAAASRPRSQATATRMLAALAEPIEVGGRPLRVSACIGIADRFDLGEAAEQTDGFVVDDLYARAEVALHDAQLGGRGRIRLWHPTIARDLSRRRHADQTLRHGLADDGITVHYQPIVRVSDGAAVASEALVRFVGQDAELGAGPVLDAAASAGLGVAVDRRVLQLVQADLRRFSVRRPEGDLRMHVNVGADTLVDEGWRRDLAGIPSAQPGSPRLVVEVTEQSLLAVGSAGARVLQDIRSAGHLVALDDFGAGFTSLAMLATVPADLVKIDRSLVTGVADDPRRRAVLRGMLALAGELGLRVIAEGVETEEERQILVDLGCEEAQGFLFGRAVRPARSGAT